MWLGLSSFVTAINSNTSYVSTFSNTVHQKQDNKELISLLELISIEEDTEDETKFELGNGIELNVLYLYWFECNQVTSKEKHFTCFQGNTLIKSIALFLEISNIRI
jgi:hypothetical protein